MIEALLVIGLVAAVSVATAWLAGWLARLPRPRN
jgi:hypothetical protein